MKARLKKISLALLLLVLGATIGIRLTSTPAPATLPFYDNFDHSPIVFAHAGGDELWPGDTLYAFEHAAGLGVDVLEMDAHITKDGVLVIIHDETVDRTTNGHGLVEDMTAEEIRQLDAGYWWTRDGGATYPYRGQGITIPTLEEIFQALPGYPVNIEIKKTEGSMAQPLCDLINRYGMQYKAMIASFHNDRMEEFRQVCPGVATSGDKAEVTEFVILNYAFLGSLYTPHEAAFQVPEKDSGILIVRPGFLRGAHGRNLHVDIWTPNTPEELHKYVDMGVDGIMTDRPDILMELLGR
jgi:glycerophosphoryl diester phosphodiesterase